MHAFHADKFDCFVPMSKGLGSGLLSLTPPALRPVRLTFGTADDNYDDDGTDGSIDAAATFASYLARIPGASHMRHREAGTATTAITLAYTGAARMEYVRVHPMPHRVPKDELGDPWDGVEPGDPVWTRGRRDAAPVSEECLPRSSCELGSAGAGCEVFGVPTLLPLAIVEATSGSRKTKVSIGIPSCNKDSTACAWRCQAQQTCWQALRSPSSNAIRNINDLSEPSAGEYSRCALR